MASQDRQLLPIEVDILTAGVELRRTDGGAFHGFQLAKEIASETGARRLTAHGTLYKALGRLEDAGLLASTWEDPQLAAVEGRPRRRLYEVTGQGERVLAAWSAAHRSSGVQARPQWDPT